MVSDLIRKVYPISGEATIVESIDMVKVVTSINVVVGIVMWYLSTVKNIVVLVVTVKTQDGVILSEQGS